jgi:chromate transporter
LPRGALACIAAALVIAFPSAWIQLAVVLGGAAAGLALRKSAPPLAASALHVPHGIATGAGLLALFAALLVGLPLAAHAYGGFAAVVEAFYRSGALVFGGGHVVLPLLRETVVAPGWIAESDFLAGYGAAQAIPGPMFSLAAYLGALLPGADGGAAGALVALLSIFAPGLLLVSGALPFWRSIAVRPAAARAVAGVNAAVVGLLGAALYDPVWTSAVRGLADAAVAIAGFAFLAIWRVSPLVVVLWCVGAALVLA